jgi:hypothetical protein
MRAERASTDAVGCSAKLGDPALRGIRFRISARRTNLFGVVATDTTKHWVLRTRQSEFQPTYRDYIAATSDPSHHSDDKTDTGSTRIALQAGIKLASVAATVSVRAVVRSTAGSYGEVA